MNGDITPNHAGGDPKDEAYVCLAGTLCFDMASMNRAMREILKIEGRRGLTSHRNTFHSLCTRSWPWARI